MDNLTPMQEYKQVMAQFRADRNEAFLSMDTDKILAYAKKYEIDEILRLHRSGSALQFSRAIHTARTGALDLPLEARMESKRWLAQYGWKGLDNDLPDVEPEGT